MSYLRRWPRCGHVNLVLSSAQFQQGFSPVVVYEYGRCAECERPVVRILSSAAPVSQVRDIRRHVAWHHLGKTWEHAGNTALLPPYPGLLNV